MGQTATQYEIHRGGHDDGHDENAGIGDDGDDHLGTRFPPGQVEEG